MTMRRSILRATMLVLLSCSTAALAHESKPASASATATADAATAPVTAVVDRFSAALQKGDLATVESLLAADVLVLEGGGAERSRAEYMEHHAGHDAEFLKSAHVQRGTRTARVHGDMAWVGTESEIHATADGKPVTLLSSETMVLHKTAEGWRIVHIHWSSRSKK